MPSDVVVIDPRKARCERLRRTVTEAAKLHELEAHWRGGRDLCENAHVASNALFSLS